VIQLKVDLTEEFDIEYDAHKLFSLNTDAPQIFSSANDLLAINGLPLTTTEVPIDVLGADSLSMTILLSENSGFGDIFLIDHYTGNQVNLSLEDYSFIHNQSVSNRFTVYFTTITGTRDLEKEPINIYAYQKQIRVIIPEGQLAEIFVYNLTGQIIQQVSGQSGLNNISIQTNGYYVVRTVSKSVVSTKKVFIQ
jgi:hypothetical protein